ncbi:hypothetical protein L211DRAFT_845125 [Terfezia boudieri ATCC MYA-4762]|uniref:Uncharacterized protein n=1 Tax=Terfezia boudieri ATCC MYA-4762 TaxID=1051890 RepID=A0A3N4M1Q2_9PEZI|nr:hypothetical protein L211DRAFT_845125 [Terfezia boudieri ATCC MYA-4762]
MDKKKLKRHSSGLQESFLARKWITELNRKYPSTADLDLSGDMEEVDVAYRIFNRLKVAINMEDIPFSPHIVSVLNTQVRKIHIVVEKITLYQTLLKNQDWYTALKSLLPPGSAEDDTIHAVVSQLRQHWTDKYHGQSLAALMDKLSDAEQNWERQKLYVKAFNIVQSSGMGKSRLVAELGKEIMTLSFALRKRGETEFPPGDILAWYIQSDSHSDLIQEWSRILAPPPNEDSGDGDDDEYEKCMTFTSQLHNPLKQLLKLLETESLSTTQRKLPLLVLAFDEAANLDTETITALRRVMRILRGWPVWAIFLTTNGDIAACAPPQFKDPSGRIADGNLKHIPYFLGLELDVKARQQLYLAIGHELAKPLRQFSSIAHITMFGRPLWQVYSMSEYADLRQFVVFKLLCGQQLFKPDDRYHVFAVLASRLYLDPCFNRDEYSLLAREAVSSHLRLLSAIDVYTGLVRTVTPSEPIVSDAAAWLLLRPEPVHSMSTSGNNWSQCLTLFAEYFLSRGMVDKGTKGELYARLMCILARDYLLEEIARSSIQDRAQECTYSIPFLAHKFLEQLTGMPILQEHAVLRESKPAQKIRRKENYMSDDPVGPWALFRSGYMNFNHFSQTQISLNPETFQDLLHSLLRQHYEDFDVNKLSAAFLQVKNRMNKVKIPLGKEYREIFRQWKPRLVISIQMELGTVGSGIETQVRWPEPGIDEPYVFGIRLLGSGKDTYPVLGKHKLENTCARLVKTIVFENSGLESMICGSMVRFNSHTHKERYRLDGDTTPEDVSGVVS